MKVLEHVIFVDIYVSIYLGIELLGHGVCICSALVDAVSQFSSEWYYFMLPSVVHFLTYT